MKKLFLILATVVLGAGLGLGALFGYTVWRGALPAPLARKATQWVAPEGTSAELLVELLGFKGPRTYLVLLLNNTELRPGGGFIGSYALLEVVGGVPRLIKIEGTEVLYAQARQAGRYDQLPLPPSPLARYLKINRWGFRDSNWSPDFAESASTSLALYRLEGGERGAAVDVVIGLTATVAEEFLKLIGSVTAGGQTFTAANVIERVEYEVEYGYEQQGKSFAERKQLLAELAPAVLKQAARGLFTRRAAYRTLIERLLREKQITLYASEAALQRQLEAAGWAGRPATTTSDYLLWVDANLGALKTDWAIRRELSYRVAPTSSGALLATAAMRYQHTAPRDWRTSRYQTYARIFVPAGSRLAGATQAKSGRPETLPAVDQGIEGGRQWFGVWFTVEPLQEAVLQFTYEVARAVGDRIRAGDYRLAVDKQNGAPSYPLTVALEFGKTVTFARPPEAAIAHGDTRYELTTDLAVDREFEARLAP